MRPRTRAPARAVPALLRKLFIMAWPGVSAVLARGAAAGRDVEEDGGGGGGVAWVAGWAAFLRSS